MFHTVGLVKRGFQKASKTIKFLQIIHCCFRQWDDF